MTYYRIKTVCGVAVFAFFAHVLSEGELLGIADVSDYLATCWCEALQVDMQDLGCFVDCELLLCSNKFLASAKFKEEKMSVTVLNQGALIAVSISMLMI